MRPFYEGTASTTFVLKDEKKNNGKSEVDYPVMVNFHFHPSDDICPSKEDLRSGWYLREDWIASKGLFVLPLNAIGTIKDKRNIDLLILQDIRSSALGDNGFLPIDLRELIDEENFYTPEDIRDALNRTRYYHAVFTRLSGV